MLDARAYIFSTNFPLVQFSTITRADPGFEVRGGANGLEDFETGGGIFKLRLHIL